MSKIHLGICDKCGREVPDNNNAVRLDMVISGQSVAKLTGFLLSQSRHILPVVEGGRVVCPGSPSRAQYLPGQPRDPRYPYQQDMEAKYREAYAKIQNLS